MALTESEELELLELENEEAGAMRDAQADIPRTSEDYGEALLTNLPTSGFVQDVVRGLPATAGAIPGAAAGAALGIPFGPLGIAAGGVIGAGLGGAAGESTRQAASQFTAASFPEEQYPVSRPGGVLRDVGIQGALQAAGHGAGAAVGAAAGAIRPGINRLGAQFMRAAAGVPEKVGEAAMRTPGILLDAPTSESASAGYKAFERYTGLKGLGDMVKSSGRFPSEAQLEDMVFGIAKKATEGTAQPQELYLASQAESNLKKMAKLGNPRYATLEASIIGAKQTVDDALGKIYPEYASLRSDYFAAGVGEEFSSLFPLNKNTSPNVLRAVTAAGTAVAGTLAGQPAALAALPLVSPAFYGLGLRGAAIAGRLPPPAYRVIPQAAAGAIGSYLSDYYGRTAP